MNRFSWGIRKCFADHPELEFDCEEELTAGEDGHDIARF
jgi:hypothetical protein